MKTFYWFFRPLIIFSKFVGVLPLSNVFNSNPKYLHHKFFSFATLYSFIIFQTFIAAIYFLSEIELSFSETNFFLSLVILLIIVRSIVCYIICVHYCGKLPKLIRLLDIFDVKKEECLYSKTNNIFILFLLRSLFPILFILVLLFLSSWETAALFEEVYEQNSSSNNKKLASYAFAFLSMWQVLPSFLYSYFSITIGKHYTNINMTLKKKQYIGNYFDEHVKYDENMGDVLEQIRYLHNMLSECVFKLGNVFGYLMAIDRLCIIAMFVVNISALVNGDGHNTHLLAVTILNAIQVFVVIFVSDYVKGSVSCLKKIQAIIFGNEYFSGKLYY